MGGAGNKAACSECGNTDHFKAECAIRKSKKRVGPIPTQHPAPRPKHKGGKAKGQKGKEGKGGSKAVKFDCLEMNECDPVIGEIPENEVNLATRKINLANALVVGDWGQELGRRLF